MTNHNQNNTLAVSQEETGAQQFNGLPAEGKPPPVVERLDDEAARLSGQSIERGCVDSGLASNLAREAADTITDLLEALASIAYLRPPGDCRNPLVKQMERIAIDAISRAKGAA